MKAHIPAALTSPLTVTPENWRTLVWMLCIIGVLILVALVVPPIVRRARGIPRGDTRDVQSPGPQAPNHNKTWGGRWF